MALAVDNISGGESNSPLTFNHTLGTTDPNGLIVVVAHTNSGNAGNLSATFNGVAMNVAMATGSQAIFYLNNPPTGKRDGPTAGTYSIVITDSSTGTKKVSAGSISFTGADQVTPLGTPVHNSGTSTLATFQTTVTVVTTKANSIVVSMGGCASNNIQSTQAGVGDTQITAQPQPMAIEAQQKAVATASSDAESTTFVSTALSNAWEMCGVEVIGVYTHAYTSALSESYSIVDSIIRSTSRIFTDTVTLIENYANQARRIFTDALDGSFVDSMVKKVSKPFSDALDGSFTDSIIRMASRAFNDSITMADSFVWTISKPFSEVFTLADSMIKKWFTTFTDTFSIVDTFIRGTFRSYSDSLTLSDSITRLTNKALTDVFSIAETIAKFFTHTFPTEVFTITDSMVKMPGKLLTEAFTLSDSIIKSTVRNFTDTVVIIDAVINSTSRSFSDALTITDSFSHMIVKAFNDSISLADSIIKSTVRNFVDVVNIVENFTKILSRPFTEVLTISDSFIKMLGRSFADTFTLADSILKQLNRTFTDTITITEQFIRGRIFTDSFLITDTIQVLVVKLKSFTDSIVITDSIQRFVSKIFSDVITFHENFGFAIPPKMKEVILAAVYPAKNAIIKATNGMVTLAGRILGLTLTNPIKSNTIQSTPPTDEVIKLTH